MNSRLRLPRSRTGTIWISLVLLAAVLLVLIIFILQNLQKANVHFLGANGKWPIGAALLLAAVFGMLLVAVPTATRILQLRVLASRRQRTTAVLTTSSTAVQSAESAAVADAEPVPASIAS